jgi:hypothetical protein
VATHETPANTLQLRYENMRYLQRFIIVGLWSVITILCAQTQNDATPRGVPETENPQAPVDSKAIESYWTKERMEKAKPRPTPTVILHPNAPETPQPIAQSDKKSAPSGKPGNQ